MLRVSAWVCSVFHPGVTRAEQCPSVLPSRVPLGGTMFWCILPQADGGFLLANKPLEQLVGDLLLDPTLVSHKLTAALGLCPCSLLGYFWLVVLVSQGHFR